MTARVSISPSQPAVGASEARQAGGTCRGAVVKPRTRRAVHRLDLWAGGLSAVDAISEVRELRYFLPPSTTQPVPNGTRDLDRSDACQLCQQRLHHRHRTAGANHAEQRDRPDGLGQLCGHAQHGQKIGNLGAPRYRLIYVGQRCLRHTGRCGKGSIYFAKRFAMVSRNS